MNRNRTSRDADPNSLLYELTAPARQRLWSSCCQASNGDHRFDCRAVPPERRGPGPFGPVQPPTPAQLVARLVVDEPRPGVLRVREAP